MAVTWKKVAYHDEVVKIVDIDDSPVDGETATPISSNWAFDHAALTDIHSISRTAYVLAASDSSVLEKAQADVVCDGTADQVEINTAIAAGYKHIVLLPGTYYLNIAGAVTYCILIAASDVEFECQGTLYLNNAQDAHVIQVGNDSDTFSNVSIRVNKINGNDANQSANFYYGITAFKTNFLKIEGYIYNTSGSAVKMEECDYAHINIRTEDVACHNLYLCDCESCIFDIEAKNCSTAIVGIEKGGYHIGRATSRDCNDYGVRINDNVVDGTDLGHNIITVNAYGSGSDYGIDVVGSSNNQFFGNLNNFAWGIVLDATSDNNIFKGNIVNCTNSISDLASRTRKVEVVDVEDLQLNVLIASTGFTSTVTGSGYNWSTHRAFVVGTSTTNPSTSILASQSNFYHILNDVSFASRFFAKFKTDGNSQDLMEGWIGWQAAYNTFPTPTSNHYGVKIISTVNGTAPALSATNGAGAAETTTPLIASLAFQVWYYVWCVYGASKILFYYSTDGFVWTLGATHTTNIPTAVNMVPGLAVNNAEALDKRIFMINFATSH